MFGIVYVMEKEREFACICGTKDSISLGVNWMGSLNMIIIIPATLIGLVAIFHPQYRESGTAIILLFAGIQTFHYTNIYRDMIKRGHNPVCAKKCARVGMWYQAVGSSYHIYTPRSTKTKSVKSTEEK